MDKNKRTDLLAAGRKKLQQYRQKKEKGGGKDGKPSGKSGRTEKDPNVEDLTKITEPEPTTSAVSSNATTSMDSGDVNESGEIRDTETDNLAVENRATSVSSSDQRVDVQFTDSGRPSDGGVEESRGIGLKEIQVGLIDNSGSLVSADLIDIQAAEPPGLNQHNDQSFSSQYSTGEDRKGEDDLGITVVDPDDRAAYEESKGPTVGFKVDRDVMLSPSDAARIDVHESPVSISENTQNEFVGVVHVQENLLVENKELAAPDTEAAQELTGIFATAGSVKEGELDISAESKDTTFENNREYEVAADSSASVDKSKLTLPSQVPHDTVFEQSFEVGQITPDNKITSEDYKENMENPSLQIISVLEKERTSMDKAGNKGNLMERDKMLLFSEEVYPVEISEEGALSPAVGVSGAEEDTTHSMSRLANMVSSNVCSVPNNFSVEFDDLKRHLYLTSIARDFLQLQLDEQSKLSTESSYQTSSQISELSGLVKETQEKHTRVTEDLAHCKSELQIVTSAREDLEVLLISKKQEIEDLRIGVSELESKLESSQKELLILSAELAACRGSFDSLHSENLNLTTRLTLEEELRKATEEEKNFLASQNLKLASEVSEYKERLLFSLDKQNQLEHNVRESLLSFEQLLEENLCLCSSSIIYKLKIEDLVHDALKSNPLITGSQAYNDQVDGINNVVENLQNSSSPRPVVLTDNNSFLKVDHEAFSTSIDLETLKLQLKEAKNTLQTLEKSIQGLHADSLSRSSEKVTKSGVSSLIKAFETKGNLTESSPEDGPVFEGGQLGNSYATTKVQTSHLNDVLVQMELEIQNFEVHISEEWGKRELSRNNELDNRAKQIDMLQAKVDELLLQLLMYKSKVEDVQKQFDGMQKDAHDEAGRLSSQVAQLQNEVAFGFSALKQERETALDAVLGAIKGLNECMGLKIADDLDVGQYVIMSVDAAVNSFGNLEKELDAVNVKNKSLSDMFTKVNDISLVLEQTNDLAFSQMHRMYLNLLELLPGSYGTDLEVDVNMKTDRWSEILFEKYGTVIMHMKKLIEEHHLILSKNYELEERLLAQKEESELLIKDSDAVKNKFVDLQNIKGELELLLINKTAILEEATIACLALAKKLGSEEQNIGDGSFSRFSDIVPKDDIVPMDDMDSNSLKVLLFQIEASVNKYIQNYGDIVEQLNISKDLLQFNMPLGIFYYTSSPLPVFLRDELIPRVYELMGHLDWLFSLNIKYETESQILKDFVIRMERALGESYSELQRKSYELEQSEQRLSSVREKLSIAVSKGKGLVAQRDSLKQSLNEKSSELEKLSQELQSKENYVREIEAKLKSHTEVGRVEALESELSYIRNSATALRDSFLLKDSILQRIEEVLEELDLPEHFHSKEIVEKVELLSRLVVTKSSFTTADWDKKTSVGRSHSDGDVLTEGWKDDSQEVFHLGLTELKNEYEELERKFNYLAEENDMLKQSLVEGNNFVHRLEDVLATINLPLELRSLQPEYQIEWLGNTLFELEQERVSLQSKFEELEKKFSSENDNLKQSLVERSNIVHKLEDVLVAINVPQGLRLLHPEDKIQWLGSKLLEVGEERDAFALKIQDLESELKHSVVEGNNLVYKLEDILATTNVPVELSSLQPEYKIEWLVNTLSGIEQERDALQVKIENLETSSDMLVVDLEESQKRISELRSEIAATKSEKDLFAANVNKLRYESDALLEKVIISEIDRDTFQNELDCLEEKMTEKEQQLHNLETKILGLIDFVGKEFHDWDDVFAISDGNAIERLEGFFINLVDKYKNLIADKRNIKNSEQVNICAESESNVSDVNQQELTSLRLELQEASSSLALVKEERDEAKDRSHALMIEVEELYVQQKALQEGVNTQMEKNHMLMSEMELMRKEKDSLIEQLTLEEQKSASAREKLNIAVRKGKSLVQQRDSLKQALEEMNASLDQLKSANSQQVETLESEKLSLVKQLEECEQKFDSANVTLNKLLTILHDIDIGDGSKNFDPIQKLEEILKLISNLRTSIISCEQETHKYKNAAELLIAELNEAQERSDLLQEELEKAETAALHSSKKQEIAEAANNEEKRKQIDNLAMIMSYMDQLRKICIELSGLLASSFKREVDVFHTCDGFMKSIDETTYHAMAHLPSVNPWSEEISDVVDNLSEVKMLGQSDNRVISEQLSFASSCAHECVGIYGQLKLKLQRHSAFVDEHIAQIAQAMESMKLKFTCQEEECESLRGELSELKQLIEDKENEILLMRRNLTLLHHACVNSIAEMEKSAVPKNDIVSAENITDREHSDSPGKVDLEESTAADALVLGDDYIRSITYKLFSTAKDIIIAKGNEGNLMELKTTVMELQRELQEKDVQMNTVTAELVSQLRHVEDTRDRSLTDLESARARISSLEKQIEVIDTEKKDLELKVNEFENLKVLSHELEGRIKITTDGLNAKDQEIEALMQALDEEEIQMENLVKRNSELEKVVAEKNVAIENLEASRAKISAKLSTTVSKFDELHNLSESLLTEVESLQSQVQSQDSEISFLRQEVTGCTNELLVSQETSKKYSSQILELLKWLDMTASRFGLTPTFSDDEFSQVHAYTALLDRSIASTISELDDLRLRTRSLDAQLQNEKVRAEELSSKYKVLETSLRENEIKIRLLEDGESSSELTNGSFSGTKTIEKMKTKSPSGAIATHVRSGRKVNGDQIAIAIDEEKENMLEDEDDDKAHGFKSLLMSRFIPRVSRPLVDRIDGMWVSGDRLLMRQPVLRLGVLIYWVALHALLASLI